MRPIYVLEKDCSHDGVATAEQVRRVFGNRAIERIDPAQLPWDSLKESAALYVFAKENNVIQPDGSVLNWITPEREKALYDYVTQGGSVLFLHNGLVSFPENSLWHQMAGGIFVRHPVIRPVKYSPLAVNHPILEGVEPFEGEDEQYFCNVRLGEVHLIMGGYSAGDGCSIAGWYRTLGKGRIVSLTPGHTVEIVSQKSLCRLIRNAASWATGEDFPEIEG